VTNEILAAITGGGTERSVIPSELIKKAFGDFTSVVPHLSRIRILFVVRGCRRGRCSGRCWGYVPDQHPDLQIIALTNH
jgi:hypothetical protein